MSKTILNYWDLSNRVQFVMNNRQDNDVTDLTSAVYAKKETELL